MDYRLVKIDSPKHADFHHYAICEVIKDRFDNVIHIGKPVEVKAMNKSELIDLINELVEALHKDTLKESVYPKKLKSSHA